MLVPFEQLPDDARIWIYQSDRPFTVEQTSRIREKLNAFVENWTAHSRMLAGGYEIMYDLFIIIGIDEKMAMASGCSIDKSVHVMKELEKDLQVSLLDRMVFAFKKNTNVYSVSRKEFGEKVNTGEINNETIVFNNLVDRKSGLRKEWEVPMRSSWHAQLVR